MRLVGFEHRGGRWIGRQRDRDVLPIAPVDVFYTDVEGLTTRVTEGAIALEDVVLVPPVPTSARILCAAANYPREPGEARPTEPALFGRWASSLATDGDVVPIPLGEERLDWEGELVAVIGRQCERGTTAVAAERAVLGFLPFNDLTPRDHLGRFFTVGKNADRSGPMGSCIVTVDEVPDPYDLRIVTRVNGAVVQDGRTGDMFHRIGELIAHAASCMTLDAGDVIATGTPPGGGAYRDPPSYLGDGDVVSVEVVGIGSITNTVVALRGPNQEALPSAR